MKSGKFLVVLYALIFLFVLAGSTFAYFTLNNQSNEGGIGTRSASVGINLLVDILYADKPLIPMDDTDVMKAYKQNCIDDNSYGACHTYTITIINIGEEYEYSGKINFDIEHVENLNYILLDEDDEEYVSQTRIVGGIDQTLGDTFTLPEGGSREFKLIVWLSNIDDDQFDIDGNGFYNATVTYRSSGNYQITGSISGS